MGKSGFISSFMLFVLVVMLFAVPAQAQATRTWVSGVGDDANPCSRTAPCKTFAGAISKTASPGEINCLDPAGFGAVTITKAINIICDSVSNGGVLVAGTNGIVVNLPSGGGQVMLSGLDFEGLSPGPSAGLNGVQMSGFGKLFIRNSVIRDFSQYGVNEVGGALARVVIENTLITNNVLGGLKVLGASGVENDAVIDQCIFDNNGAASITIAGLGTIVVSRSLVEGAAAAYAISGGGTVQSYGNNIVRGSGSPTTTLPPS